MNNTESGEECRMNRGNEPKVLKIISRKSKESFLRCLLPLVYTEEVV